MKSTAATLVFSCILSFLPAPSLVAGWDSTFESNYPGYQTTSVTATSTTAYFADINGNIYKWTSSGGWVLLTNYQFDGYIYHMSLSGSYLYVAGDFEDASYNGNTVTLNRVARVTLSNGAISALGSGINNRIDVLAVASTPSQATGDFLYVGGIFSQAGGSSAANIASWDGTSWSSMSGGLPITVGSGSTLEGVHALGVNLVWTGSGYNHQVIAAGRFTLGPNVAVWNEAYSSGSWSAGASDGVGGVDYDGENNCEPLYVGVHDQAVSSGAFLNGTGYFIGNDLTRIGYNYIEIPNCTQGPDNCPCPEGLYYGKLSGSTASPSLWDGGQGWSSGDLLAYALDGTGGYIYGITSDDGGSTFTVSRYSSGSWTDITGGVDAAPLNRADQISKTSLGLFVAGADAAKRWQ